MESRLNSDVLFSVLKELKSTGDLQDVKNLSLSCRLFRVFALPLLFSNVQWPHGDKHTEGNGLEFFPESLWPYFKNLSLIWPDNWPDASPPLWGDRYYLGGDYHPRHLDKLIIALPRMTSLISFHMSCPFYPPNSIITALIQCPSIKELSIQDTPLYAAMIPRVPAQFNLQRISIVPVAEALRVGEGPYDSKYQEVTYYIRDYRKKYKNDSLARYAAQALMFNLGKTDSLQYVQISGDLCSLTDLILHEWPHLETLVLTGHAPRPEAEMGVEFIDVLAKMPKLMDLRLLFATVKNDPPFRLIPSSENEQTVRGNPASLLRQIRYLALSNACHLSGVFQHATNLERLLICAISELPRVPVALSRAEIDSLLDDIASGPADNSGIHSKLKLLRIMIEDKANLELYHKICHHFPQLETLEVELCGYHDGKSIYAWNEFTDAFVNLQHLKRLRICIQFPEFDEADRGEPWRNARKECASYFATRLPNLERVGFEFRKRTGTHRYEDSWLEYDIEHRHNEGRIQMHELPSSWYRFPEVWKPEYLPL